MVVVVVEVVVAVMVVVVVVVVAVVVVDDDVASQSLYFSYGQVSLPSLSEVAGTQMVVFISMHRPRVPARHMPQDTVCVVDDPSSASSLSDVGVPGVGLPPFARACSASSVASSRAFSASRSA